jgi:hypothetical protein
MDDFNGQTAIALKLRCNKEQQPPLSRTNPAPKIGRKIRAMQLSNKDHWFAVGSGPLEIVRHAGQAAIPAERYTIRVDRHLLDNAHFSAELSHSPEVGLAISRI